MASHYPYDLFISHNHADKDFARALALQLSRENYHGRLLRPWLDEQFLDPGELGSEQELTSALDHSRIFGLVASRAAVMSTFVQLEIRHFLETRTIDDAVTMLRSTEVLTHDLSTACKFDFCSADAEDNSYVQLVSKLCPPSQVTVSSVHDLVTDAFNDLLAKDPGGLDATQTNVRDNYANELLRFDIDDAAEEGLVMEAFRTAAKSLSALPTDDDRLYNQQMLLGECLAIGRLRSSTNRQVFREFILTGETSLLFVVARAYSKLAEVNTTLVDFSILLQLIQVLDARAVLSNTEKALLTLISRIAGKTRHTTAGELFIKTVSSRGAAGKWCAIGSIGYAETFSPSLYYLAELEHQAQPALKNDLQHRMPSKKLLSLLNDLNDVTDPLISRAVFNAREDLRRAFPGEELIYYMSWYGRRDRVQVLYSFNAPFYGKVIKATLQNMVALQNRVGSHDLVCLSEARVVDALFYHAAALIITAQDTDSLLCLRLRSRNISFCMLSAEDIISLSIGDYLAVDVDGSVHYPATFYQQKSPYD